MAALSDWKAMIGEIRDIKDRESAPGFEDSPVLDRCELQLRKWRLIHKHVHGHPFRDRPRTCRSEQWRDAADRVRDLFEPELLDWALEQAEVARNIERGVQDLRPRKCGPCHKQLLGYANNRKRKALALYKWALAAGEAGTATDATLTEAILDRHDTRGTGGTENL